jgi:hypothetical protein
MDTPTGDFQRGAIRVSDAERDQAVAQLSEHYQSGRLTLEEFDDRSNLALRAKTGTDLAALFGDLPKTAAAAARSTVTPADSPVPPVLSGRRGGHPVAARAIIACVIAAILLSNLTINGHHQNVGWLVPVVVLSLVFLRMGRRR